jgi:hypothetical protein
MKMHAMGKLAVLLTLALAGCSRKDPAKLEFERWKALARVSAPVDGPRLARDIAAAGKYGASVGLPYVKPVYLRKESLKATDGTLVVLYTSDERIPDGMSFVPMARVQALAMALEEKDAAGVCLDPDAKAVCRASLTTSETGRLYDLVKAAAGAEAEIPFKVYRRK